jgi:hypothetical protein
VPPISSFTSATTDGSGFTMNIGFAGVAPIVTRDGLNLYPPSSPAGSPVSTTKTDRNGNQITSDSSGHFYDALSSTTAVLTVSGSGTPSSPMKFTYTPSSGGSATYQINYTSYTVATNFAVSGISEYKSSTAVPLVSSVVLPDGSQYTFGYEPTPSTPSSGACNPYAGTTCVRRGSLQFSCPQAARSPTRTPVATTASCSTAALRRSPAPLPIPEATLGSTPR